MKLIDDIIELLTEKGDGNLQSAFIKAQVLAHKLGDAELGAWIRSELVGYEKGADVPAYRVHNLTIYGNVANGAYRYTNYRLPTLGVPDNFKNLMINTVQGSVAVIEEFSTKTSLQIPIPPELYSLFQAGLDRSYHVESAWGVVSEGAFQQMLVEIRSRLLDFLLKLSDKFPVETTPEQMRKITSEVNVNDLFKGAVFGPNAVLNVAVNGATANQLTKHTIVQNDFETLALALKSFNVSEEDVKSLKMAVDEDGALATSEKTFGSKVRGWMGAMIAKAGSASWDVSMQTAGGLLTAALSKFYGLEA